MSSPNERVRNGKASGRRSLAVPALREKIDYLLARTGRQNQWLTEVLVTPDGTRPSKQGVANWKSTGNLPIDYMVSFRFVFGLDEKLLLEPDLDAFRAAADAVMMPGSGRFWKTLLESAEQGPNALWLVIDGAPDPEPQRRLRNLHFHRPGANFSPALPTASFEDGIRFAISGERLAEITGGADPADVPLTLILCCEDKLGWKTITPTRHHPGFEPDGARWLFPGAARGPLYFHEAVGNYRAVLVAIAVTLPKAIEDALRADRTVWGTDALAAWLFDTRPRWLVMDRPFLVTTMPRRR